MTFLSIGVGSAVGAIGSGISSAASASQASKASKAAQKAYQQALTQTQSTIDANNKQAQGLMNPYIQAGQQNLNMLNSAMNPMRSPVYNQPASPTPASEDPQEYLQGLAGIIKNGRVK